MRARRFRPAAHIALLVALLSSPRPAAALWPPDPAVNVPLCTAPGDQNGPAAVADGAGGAIVAWTDLRTGTSSVHAQRVSGSGIALWTASGVAVGFAAAGQYRPAVVSDGAGGAIVAWEDWRDGNSDIYAQRLSASGEPQWTAAGVAVCSAAGDQYDPVVVTDGAGGTIVAWYSSTLSAAVAAQRVSATGVVQWLADGVALASTGSSPVVVSDGAGGAIAAWSASGAGDYDIRAQRVSAGGAVLWAAGGVPLCAAVNDQTDPAIASDDAGGAIVTWSDLRNDDGSRTNLDVYSQRVSSAGVARWTANGVALCTARLEQAYPTLVPDGAGGAIVAWSDRRGGAHLDLYAQRVSSAGAARWTTDGVALTTATDDQWHPALVPDGAGGAIAAWEDRRSGTNDIQAQRVSAEGVAQWTADGIPLCTAPGDQYSPRIVPDGDGGVVAAWEDFRGDDCDIYAQHADPDGQLGSAGVPAGSPLTPSLEPVRPNPSRGALLTVQFTLADGAAASLELLDVAGRRIVAREVGALGAGRHTVDLAAGRRLAPGLYLVRLSRGSDSLARRVVVLR